MCIKIIKLDELSYGLAQPPQRAQIDTQNIGWLGGPSILSTRSTKKNHSQAKVLLTVN